MRSISERTAEIRSMPTEELRRRITSGELGELRPVAQAELEARDKREESGLLDRTEEREDAAISIAREANSIAKDALCNSKRANNIAIIAAMFAAAATIKSCS